MNNAHELGVMWLRDRARTLDNAAVAAERAYGQHSKLGRTCALVATKCRAAALLLHDAAKELEDHPELIERAAPDVARCPGCGGSGVLTRSWQTYRCADCLGSGERAASDNGGKANG